MPNEQVTIKSGNQRLKMDRFVTVKTPMGRNYKKRYDDKNKEEQEDIKSYLERDNSGSKYVSVGIDLKETKDG